MTRLEKRFLILLWLTIACLALWTQGVPAAKAYGAEYVEDNWLKWSNPLAPYSEFGIHCFPGGTNWNDTTVCSIGFNWYNGGVVDLTKSGWAIDMEYAWFGLAELNIDTYNPTTGYHRILAMQCGVTFDNCGLSWQGYFAVRSTQDYENAYGGYQLQVCVLVGAGCPVKGTYIQRLFLNGQQLYIGNDNIVRRCQPWDGCD